MRQEQQRLNAIVREWQAKRAAMHSNWDDGLWTCRRAAKSPHAEEISRSYIGYDKEYETQMFSPCFLSMIAEHLGFASQAVRKSVYGPGGLVNLGFDVEGKVPIYGVWPEAKKLTCNEKQRVKDAEADVAAAIAQIDTLAKFREEPYAFEDAQTQKRCYEAIQELWKGPHAEKIEKKEIPKNTWVFPYFGY
eukprot:g1670.t1